jgi:hypothetical protein
MHDLLANYRVGSITLKVVEMELKKAEHWCATRPVQRPEGLRTTATPMRIAANGIS